MREALRRSSTISGKRACDHILHGTILVKSQAACSGSCEYLLSSLQELDEEGCVVERRGRRCGGVVPVLAGGHLSFEPCRLDNCS